MAGTAALLSRTQRTQSQPSSNIAADRVTKRLVHNARSGARHGNSVRAPLDTSAPAAAAVAVASSSASDAAASVLKQASVAGKLGCPKCRQAVYGCKKCRAAYVRNTGISIPVDRSLHADIFSMLQHPSAFIHSAAKSSQLVVGQKPSSAGIVKSASQAKQGDRASEAVHAGKGKVAAVAMPKGRVPDGQKASSDRETFLADRRGSAKFSGAEALVQQPARKKQKAAATPDATAAAETGARVSSRAASGSKRLQTDSSPDVRKMHADSAPPAAKRSRVSQTPKVPAAANKDPDQSTAIKGLSAKLCTAGKAAAGSAGQPSSSAKSASQAARPSSSSAGKSSGTAKQPSKAVRRSVPAALSRSATGPAAGKPQSVAVPKQAASAFKQACRHTSALPKSNRKGSGPGMKTSSSSPAPPLPAQAAAKARSVASPKAMPADQLRQTPSSRAAAAAGSLLVQSLDSNLGCSKCRFVATGCKRCRAKQAGHKNLGTAA